MNKHLIDYTMIAFNDESTTCVCSRITTYPEFSAFRHSEKYLIKNSVS